MAELGKIERPTVESFQGKKKLYTVPNIYQLKEFPDDLKKLIDRYWQEVEEQLLRLESAGKISKIFCENVYSENEKGLKILRKTNEKAHELVQKKLDEGARLLSLEDRSLYAKYLDWRNCLAIVQTEEVFQRVFDAFQEVFQKRIEHFKAFIENSLSEGEAGLLIISDEERVKIQFPSSIEVFLVTPPSYDDIIRWFRDNREKLSLRPDQSS
ncbi:MAG: hypothetical protein GXO97_01165 [Nitrospirae bacterium]|nr:hypothetical protein [Nitrospirota bacterium]